MALKIIVAHPGRQHSFRIASALKKNNRLLCYCTTIYDKDSSWLMRIVKFILSRDNQKRASGRKNKDLADKDVIQFCEAGGMIEAFLVRICKGNELYRMMQRFDARRFGIKVAKLAIKEKADAVVMYDSNAYDGFAYLKKHAPDIIRILDTSIAARPFMREIYQREVERSGHDDLKRQNSYMWNEKKMLPVRKEIMYSHFFLAASDFVRDSLRYCGVKDGQIKTVPYGANVDSDIIRTPDLSGDKKIEFLFVGQVSYRKGVSYLIECMPQFIGTAHLTITGAYNPADWYVRKGKETENISFTGLVTFDHMKEIYEQADVFVLPSFAEGMAQVGIEAMACGLPIICTYNAGLSGLVRDGVNGFMVEPGNAEQLTDKMRWFIDHREKIAEMGQAAREAASVYTWDAYDRRIMEVMTEMTEKSR